MGRHRSMDGHLCQSLESARQQGLAVRAGFDGTVRGHDLAARAFGNTQYLSQIARAYLDALYDGQDGKSYVWVVPGRLTKI